MSKSTPDIADQQINFTPEFLQIPSIVGFDNDLQPLDKLVYAVVFWLERLRDGKCFASNGTIAKIVGSSASGVANSLVRLRDKGYVACVYGDAGHRKEIKTLVFNTVNPYSNEEGGVTQMSNIGNNTKKNFSCSDEERAQALELHKGYIRHFKLDQSDYSYASDSEKAQMVEKALKTYKLTDKRLQKAVARIRDAGFHTCKKAILNVSRSNWHHGENPSGWKMDLYEYLFRNYEQVEKWANK